MDHQYDAVHVVSIVDIFIIPSTVNFTLGRITTLFHILTFQPILYMFVLSEEDDADTAILGYV